MKIKHYISNKTCTELHDKQYLKTFKVFVFHLFVSFIKISCTTKVENAPLPEISDLVSMLIALLTETSLQQDK